MTEQLFIATVDLSGIGALLVGVSALLTAVGGVGVMILKRSIAKTGRDVEVRIDDLVANHLEGQLIDRELDSYYTLDISFENGVEIIVPMIPLAEITVAKNLHLFVSDHNGDETTIQLRSTGFASLPPHHHSNSIETIEVRRGTVTHLETGHIYRHGDMWEVAINEVHSAVFSDNFLAFIVHRPALPTAKQRPVNLEALKNHHHANN